MKSFHQHQRRARQQTILLVVLFTFAVITLVTSLNILIAYIYALYNEELWALDHVKAKHWFTITLMVLLVIGGASYWRWAQLRGGGQEIARSLGGTPIYSNSDDFYERRLLNIVEEMALSSGLPVPPVYVIAEPSINAFAAGYSVADAVIGVTEGAMKKLTRDQLQGVIAHEFSHILNGDMRFNVRLLAVLYGIVFIALIGRLLLEFAGDMSRNTHRNKRGNELVIGLIILSTALMVIGYSGLLFGSLIKAAISRQREYLADASAVQFTRNPKGISGALKVIAMEGSQLRSSASQEASHFFFGDVRKPNLFRRLIGIFATHPPLDKRIRRLEPYWKGGYISPQSFQQARAEIMSLSGQHSGAAYVLSGEVNSAADELLFNALNINFSEELLEYARDPGTAPFLTLLILIARRAVKDNAQLLQTIAGMQSMEIAVRSLLQMQQHLSPLKQTELLALLELAMPALKQMDKGSYNEWQATYHELLQGNSKFNLFEWCLEQMLNLYLNAHFNPTRQSKKYTGEFYAIDSAAVIMSLLASVGSNDQQEREQAFKIGCAAAKFKNLTMRSGVLNAEELEHSIEILRYRSFDIRARAMDAFKAIAAYDKQLTANEMTVLRMLAICLDVPLNSER